MISQIKKRMKPKLTKELAEICGIHAGDGYLRNDGKRRELDISGDIEEESYYQSHVIPLFENCFNIKITGKLFPSRNTYGFVIRTKDVIEFMHELGFPYGSKSTIVQIPRFILTSNNKELHKKFLRGIFDTDGHLGFSRKNGNYSEFKLTKNYYPRIILTSCSKILCKQIKCLLDSLEIHSCFQTYVPKKQTENIKYKIVLHGVNFVEQWMNLIGTKNSSKETRYIIWKKHGFCPPNTSYKQRISIIKEKLNPNNIFGPVT